MKETTDEFIPNQKSHCFVSQEAIRLEQLLVQHGAQAIGQQRLRGMSGWTGTRTSL